MPGFFHQFSRGKCLPASSNVSEPILTRLLNQSKLPNNCYPQPRMKCGEKIAGALTAA